MPSFSTITMYVLGAASGLPICESVVPAALSFVMIAFFAVRSKSERRESSVDGVALRSALMTMSQPFPPVPVNV